MDFYYPGSYLWAGGAAGSLYDPGGNLWSAGIAGSGLAGMLPGSMTASAQIAPVYAKFADALQKTLGERQSFGQGGDVVLSFPPKSTDAGRVDESRDRSEMSQEEYKKYICGRISSLPVSASCRANCSGVLVLKEEALARMQKDPAYEKEILSGLEKEFQAQYSCYAPKFGFRVIGGSREECSGAGMAAVSGTGESSGRETGVRRSRLEEQRARNDYGAQMQQMRSTGGGSLADRLASNRAARLQERMAQRQEGSI